MKVLTLRNVGPRVLLLFGITLLMTGCGGSGDSLDIDNAKVELAPIDVSATGASSTNYNLWDLVDTLPYEHLSDAEFAALDFMREEEKLARDVYRYLYDIWGSQIFTNIADSEQTHTDAVLHLMHKYDLADPAEGKGPGEYSDPMLQGLYDMLIAQGSASLVDALVVGATIEDLDIYDLHRQLAVVDNEDITVVFEALQLGSRNHMRAFSSRLMDMNVVYIPVYLSQDEYDSIINSPMETGME